MNNSSEPIQIEKHFAEVHSLIEFHRSKALQVINNESLIISWKVGAFVSEKLQSSEWGSKVVTRLSEYLRTKDPNLKGYSRRTIYKMVQFYEVYSSQKFHNLLLGKEFVPFKTAQNEKEEENTLIVPSEMAQLIPEAGMPKVLTYINWTSHCEILSTTGSIDETLFYILYAQRERLNIKELRRAIQTDTYTRLLSGKLRQSVGMRQSHPLAGYLFKDKIFLDFLGLPEKHNEKRLQNGILDNMRTFVLELGKDFLFVGQEYPLKVGNQCFKIDLLFFHRGLQCLVAIELKTKEFKPEFMGQLEFYLEALDRDVKRSNENPSIGILLCKSANKEVVEYALSRSLSPTMIAEYKRQLIPKEVLQQSLSDFCEFMNQ